ncbi:MAG: GTP-binding protein [Candidatus Tectimicrobiota bacterium]|nr:MAG: GTP-binding protein [Candidatus Tectomicrobia bacterium]
MRGQGARFLVSATSPQQYPRLRVPELAFAGRSNVGKSSLINALVRHRGLAKTSATPGKTQTLNFYLVYERFLLVDLPGYGYAEVPRAIQAGWRPMVETYLRQRPTLRAVVHVVDVRHPPTPQDCQLRAWLLSQGLPVVTVATKADKVARSRQAAHLQTIRSVLALPEAEPLWCVSARTGVGCPQLWRHLLALLAPVRPSSA